MALEPLEQTVFDLLPTPDVNERAGRLWVPQSCLREEVTMTPGTTTLLAFLSELGIDKASALDMGYGTYLLTREPPVLREGGYFGYTFAKPKTATEQATPFNEETEWIDYSWPPVLQVLLGMAGYVNGLEVVTGTMAGTSITGATTTTLAETSTDTKKRLEARERLFLVPGIRVNTEMIVREYLSPEPFDANNIAFRADQPVPTLVSFSYLGMARSLECLHGVIRVPEQMTDAQQIEDFGTENPQSIDWSRGQVFDRTNHTGWIPHICRVETGRRGGLYYLKTYEAQPPDAPKPLPLY